MKLIVSVKVYLLMVGGPLFQFPCAWMGVMNMKAIPVSATPVITLKNNVGIVEE